jgi:pyruvate dehydrogenase E2 component (dihydrolipoamide acetyltransferase)
MATVIRMPAVSAGSDEAAIQTWLVAPGQALTVGQPLAEIETEKAVVEYAAETAGTVLQLLVAEGVSVNVGDPIAVVGAQGESADDAETGPAPATVAQSQVVADAQAADDAPVVDTVAGPVRQFVSPIVRRLAKERGLDVTTVAGSGPGGRVVRRDLDALSTTAAAAPVPSAPVPAAPVPAAPVPAAPFQASAATPVVAAIAGTTEVPHTGMRRAIARRLTESKSTVPHFYLVADCRVDRLVALRTEVNESAPVKVSLNDFVLKAAAAAFVDVPQANATWGETAVTRYSTVDMSVAVAIDGGLVTPVLRSVERQTLTEIARNVADLAERARAGQLKQHELEGGSFAVSNLGMYGVTEFSAIINPPQSAILAVGRARPQAVVVDGALAVGTIMTVTLSADHRVLDGALAAQWLAAFVRHIESPLGMLA